MIQVVFAKRYGAVVHFFIIHGSVVETHAGDVPSDARRIGAKLPVHRNKNHDIKITCKSRYGYMN